jgi:hypothetical protein
LGLTAHIEVFRLLIVDEFGRIPNISGYKLVKSAFSKTGMEGMGFKPLI